MIKLFEDQVKYITSSLINNEVCFDIASNEESVILIDWTKNIVKKVIINVHGNALVKFLEINEPEDVEVIYNLDDYSNVYHSIASFNEVSNAKYQVHVGEEASYRGAFADFSYGKKHFDYVCHLDKPYARVTWNLASLATQNDDKTFYISFLHHAKHTYAKMENYGVCEHEASLNFFGTSSIEKGAKTSATHQSAKIMVFDKKCKAKASPILCIDENDVEASHAAVVGQINEDHVFYLKSRGIPEDEAKKLITLGYLNPILNFFDNEEILSSIKDSIERRF